MASPGIETTGDGGFKLRGAVTLVNAPLLLEAVQMPGDSRIKIDLSEAQGSDSALVALLLAWTRRAKAPLSCQNVPDEITSLIDLYGVTELLLQ